MAKIMHIVLFKWKSTTSEETALSIIHDLVSLKGRIPCVLEVIYDTIEREREIA